MNRRFLWFSAAVAFLAFPGGAQALEQKLSALDRAAGDNLGKSVAIDGDTAVIGADQDDGNRGAAYVFQLTDDTWTQTARLTASDRAVDDRFGSAVAIDGDTIVVGAYRDSLANGDVGSAYTFTRTGAAARNQTAKLTVSDARTNNNGFGRSVAIDGATIVVGTDSSSFSHVYTFARTGGDRNETAELTPTGRGDGSDRFGWSVDIDGDTIVAGANGDDNGMVVDQGAVYTFTSTGIDRSQTAKLTASDGVAVDFLGNSVAIDGDTIVASAPLGEVGDDDDQGALYTFTRTGSNRNETVKLIATDGAPGDQLGGGGSGNVNSVAIDGDSIFAGAPQDDVGTSDSQGSIYTWARTESGPIETGTLRPADGTEFELFGWSVAADGSSVLGGAPQATNGTGGCCHGFAMAYFEPGGPGDEEMTVELAGPAKVKKNKKAKLEAIIGPCPDVGGVEVIFEKKAGDGFEEIGTGTASGPECAASLSPKVKKKATFRARTEDAPGFLGAASQTVTVKIKK
jgi:hypothetical protein